MELQYLECHPCQRSIRTWILEFSHKWPLAIRRLVCDPIGNRYILFFLLPLDLMMTPFKFKELKMTNSISEVNSPKNQELFCWRPFMHETNWRPLWKSLVNFATLNCCDRKAHATFTPAKFQSFKKRKIFLGRWLSQKSVKNIRKRTFSWGPTHKTPTLFEKNGLQP